LGEHTLTADWLVSEYNTQDIKDLADFSGLDPAACLARLESYDLNEMAEAWRRANPITPDEIRSFYQGTDLYIWELTKWHNSSGYSSYLQLLEALIDRFPPQQYPRVLDYGSGIGTAALRMAQAGYQVTIADVPGKTLDYARFRLRKHGLSFDSVEVVNDRPSLTGDFDLFISFDVFEHIPRPDRLLAHLVRRLRPEGIAAIVATFQTYETHPHHLAENSDKIAKLWPLVTRACGLDDIDPHLYQKTGRAMALFRRSRYRLWQATGLYLVHSRDVTYLRKIVT
jgi:2-polyprenyl-3-methyl-5-hydroxy-6-metoxy-1,4-benzoquinol methylase